MLVGGSEIDDTAFTIVPYFLCQQEIDNGLIKLLWKGNKPLEITLYFAARKKTIYQEEITLIKKIFIEVM
ncbi:hypothetical protein [Flavobacterium sp.]|uniref:hypothetical protein n=1 Tax=Flavobacterium sp. TaxID=239 RepID=UPI002B4B1769|nr:hypothetical protein [Flavobacterium sp.]HLF52824.1 hypothetical protein [Flavobacterium sp.]